MGIAAPVPSKEGGGYRHFLEAEYGPPRASPFYPLQFIYCKNMAYLREPECRVYSAPPCEHFIC